MLRHEPPRVDIHKYLRRIVPENALQGYPLGYTLAMGDRKQLDLARVLHASRQVPKLRRKEAHVA